MGGFDEEAIGSRGRGPDNAPEAAVECTIGVVTAVHVPETAHGEDVASVVGGDCTAIELHRHAGDVFDVNLLATTSGHLRLH